MQKFFLTGPNRTGTTLLARCISDHPNCICLFESNIHIAAFGGISTMGHSGRMKQHGFTPEQTSELRNRVQKNNADSLLKWYDNCADILSKLYGKLELTHIGDKNPFFHTSSKFSIATAKFPKIWTIRDPRSVWYSGKMKGKNYFNLYLNNVKHFLTHKDNTTLVIKFEDLVTNPKVTMNKVYNFLELPEDQSFLKHISNKYDRRFGWNPNSTDDFDLKKINSWKTIQIPKKIIRMPLVKSIMSLYGYF